MGDALINKIVDENYYDLIVEHEVAYLYASEEDITPMNERDSLVHVPSTNADPCDIGVYPYHMFPVLYTLTAVTDFEKSGINRIQRVPNLAFFGKDVIVGIIDTGIDYRHPAFLKEDGTSRILAIWDQSIQDGPPPVGLTYGTEYTQEQINLALKSENPLAVVPSVDENGHGTAIASIAAGSENLENGFRGVVPLADLLVVKLKQAKQNIRNIVFVPDGPLCFQESDLILAIRYFHQLVNATGRPVSLCIAVGSSQGGHDGSGNVSAYLSWISNTPHLGITIAAGNEGNAQRHYFGTVDSDTFTNEFELKVSSRDRKFAFQIWAFTPARLAINIITPSGESTREVYARLNDCSRFSFIYESSVIWVNNIVVELESGDQMILIRMENPQEGVWRFRIRNLVNEVISFHAWLPAGELISRETFFLEPTPDTTITSPGNGVNPMTVTAYNQDTDNILLESGRGYTRDNSVKPDFAAPGYEIDCALPGSRYGTLTGTSAASSLSAGIVAMMLEWGVVRNNYPAITSINIGGFLTRAANRTEGLLYPNNIWGYGKIDINGVFEKLRV